LLIYPEAKQFYFGSLVKWPVCNSNLPSVVWACYTIEQGAQAMLRKGLLIVLAVVVSFGLTGIAGYLIYANSAGRSEANLSLLVRFAVNPIIAILVGVLVGYLSKDHPVLVGGLGLLPWAVMLLASPHKPTSLAGWAGWFSPLVLWLPLSAAIAWWTWRFSHRKITTG
jgi:hypothetical protein